MSFISVSVNKLVMRESTVPVSQPKVESHGKISNRKNQRERVSFEKMGTGRCKIIQLPKLKINDRVSDLRKHNIFSWRTEI